MKNKNNNIHPTAVIDPSAVIAEGAQISPYAVIGPETEIKKDVWVGPHAVIEHASIGEGCRIFSGSYVGTPPQDLKFKGEKSRVKVGSNTTIRECVTVNRGTAASGMTIVGDNCLLMAYSHVAHDCILGNNVVMANVATLAGHVEVGDDVVMGGLVAVHQYTRIGIGAMLGGGSMVTLDVAPFCMTHGDRAVIMGLNVVGLRRRGISKDNLSALKDAYKTLFFSGLSLQNAAAHMELEKDVMPPEARAFLEFIKKPSRGLCRPSSKTIEKG